MQVAQVDCETECRKTGGRAFVSLTKPGVREHRTLEAGGILKVWPKPVIKKPLAPTVQLSWG